MDTTQQNPIQSQQVEQQLSYPLDFVTQQILKQFVSDYLANDGSSLISGSSTGDIKLQGHTTLPTGWLLCDGSAVSRTTYSTLFGKIATNFGTGDGSTTFNLPDFRRKVPMGSGGSSSGTISNTVGSSGGEETHILVTAEMPAHTHGTPYGGNGAGGPTSQAAQTTSGTITSTSTGGDGAHNNIQPSLVVYYIIKT